MIRLTVINANLLGLIKEKDISGKCWWPFQQTFQDQKHRSSNWSQTYPDDKMGGQALFEKKWTIHPVFARDNDTIM